MQQYTMAYGKNACSSHPLKQHTRAIIKTIIKITTNAIPMRIINIKFSVVKLSLSVPVELVQCWSSFPLHILYSKHLLPSTISCIEAEHLPFPVDSRYLHIMYPGGMQYTVFLPYCFCTDDDMVDPPRPPPPLIWKNSVCSSISTCSEN